ncbi:glutathione S-transferase 1 [Teleopsis dalmanni]|uniref:glutathione S-transferase 1 n=1 Tax=Teleopsis dalmanni TaxID=139649 RepID=UPI0018CD4656|nr:glutathione S-transferase 1 [Teleopsis dalmanni]
MVKPCLYFALFSPPARACLITAKLIGLDIDVKHVNFAQKEHLSDDFIKLNPQHQVPIFVDDDNEIYVDSHAIICFMVSKYAEDDSLYPKNLTQRARVDHRLHFENGVLFQVIKDLVARNIYGGEGEFNQKSLDMCQNAYCFLESFLQNGKYVVGNTMTVADISINTTLITLNMLIPVDQTRYPNIVAWMELMKSLPDYEDINVKGADALYKRIITVMAENKNKSN